MSEESNVRLAMIAEVQDMWSRWLGQRGIDSYDPVAAAEFRAIGSVDEDTGQNQSDYEEHANIVSSSRENWLAYMAMLAARGITISEEGLS